MSSRSVAVLLPVKAFQHAKLRLAPALDQAARAALAREMATKVVRAARELPVAVVCDDDDVAAWAALAGATVLWRPGRGLNAAVTDGVDQLGADGFSQVLSALADPDVAAGFLEKAADLQARSKKAPDASPRPPDVEQAKT